MLSGGRVVFIGRVVTSALSIIQLVSCQRCHWSQIIWHMLFAHTSNVANLSQTMQFISVIRPATLLLMRSQWWQLLQHQQIWTSLRSKLERNCSTQMKVVYNYGTPLGNKEEKQGDSISHWTSRKSDYFDHLWTAAASYSAKHCKRPSLEWGFQRRNRQTLHWTAWGVGSSAASIAWTTRDDGWLCPPWTLPFFILHRLAQIVIIPRRLMRVKNNPPQCASRIFGQAARIVKSRRNPRTSWELAYR